MMTVVRLDRNNTHRPLDIELSDVVQISANGRCSSPGGAEVVIEADAGPRDNYRFVGSSAEITERDPNSTLPLHA